MSKIALIILTPIIILVSISTQAELRTEKYTSLANEINGSSAYLEKHEVTFKGRQVHSANTKYLNTKGEIIGEMTSDFTKMITIPDYQYKDLRTGVSHGIKLEGEKVVLWNQSKDGKTSESTFYKNKFPQGTLLVGCQGLHYYLIEKLDQVKEKKTIPIAYFIPGKLDYYNFTLKLDREDEEYLYLTLSIDNFFLKLFASSLDLKYRKSDRRLIQFTGLSNITNDKDQMQSVVINYNYN